MLYYNARGKAQLDIQDQAGLNLVTKMTYDGLDRPLSTTLPEGYDAEPGGMCTAAIPLIAPATGRDCVRLAYEATVNPWANNVKSVTRVGKDQTTTTVTSYVYDPTVNKPITVTGPPTPIVLAGQVTTVTYDPANGNVASIVPDSASTGLKPRTRYSYTALGQVASITDLLGTVTTFTYDEAGNRLSMVEDAGPGRLNRTTTYGYNSRGDAVSLTDPNGNVTRSEYDAARRHRHHQQLRCRRPAAADVQLTGDTRNWYGSSSSLHSSAVSVTSVALAAELSWSRSVAPMMGAPM